MRQKKGGHASKKLAKLNVHLFFQTLFIGLLNGYFMRVTLLLTSILVFVAIFHLPIGYYTFLRIVVTISAIIVIKVEYGGKINLWIVTFGFIAILFNLILPIYLHKKESWLLIDIFTAILFFLKGLLYKPANKK